MVPVTARPEMFKEAFPMLLKVTACTGLVVPSVWVLKMRLVAVRLTEGPPPVPVRLTVCGLPAALSEISTTAVRVPVAVGVNDTLIVQVPPAATEVPQVLV